MCPFFPFVPPRPLFLLRCALTVSTYALFCSHTFLFCFHLCPFRSHMCLFVSMCALFGPACPFFVPTSGIFMPCWKNPLKPSQSRNFKKPAKKFMFLIGRKSHLRRLGKGEFEKIFQPCWRFTELKRAMLEHLRWQKLKIFLQPGFQS